MLSGIPAAVAIATGANQVVASSVSGTITHWRRGNVDIKMGTLLLLGGIVGAFIGVQLVKVLEATRPYRDRHLPALLVFLSSIGVLMLVESLRAMQQDPPRPTGIGAPARPASLGPWPAV